MIKRPCVLVLLLVLVGVGIYVLGGFDERSKLPFQEGVKGNVSGRVELVEESAYGVRLTLGHIHIVTADKYYQKARSRVLVQYSGSEHIAKGYSVLVKGKLSYFEKANNPGQFDEYQYYRSKAYICKMKASNVTVLSSDVPAYIALLERVRGKGQKTLQKVLPSEESGIACAMVLGDKSGLSKEVKSRYAQCGISHILAISGLHITLIGMLMWKLLLRLRFPLWLASASTILFVLIYGDLTGLSLSTNRAVLMMGIAMFAKMIGKTYDLPSALAVSGVVILLQTPMAVKGGGFWLSFGAVVAIFYVMPEIRGALETWVKAKWMDRACGMVSRLMDGIAGGIAITLVTTPIVLYFQYEWTPYSVLWNLIVIPLSSILLPSLLLGCLLGCVSSLIGRVCIAPGYIILRIYDGISRLAELLPCNRLIWGRPSCTAIIIYYIFLILLFLICKKKRRKYILLSLLLPALCYPFSHNILELTMLEVGQGECMVWRFPDRSAYLLDCGSTDVSGVGEYRVVPFLKAKGIERLRGILITHTDQDHISGVSEVLNSYYGKSHPNVFLPYVDYPEESDKEFVNLVREKHCRVIRLLQGDGITYGGFKLRVLSPNREALTGDCNEDCMVCEVRCGTFSGLFTGDAGEMTERRLLNENLLSLKSYFLLKVGHHGSAQSTCEEWLDRIAPRYAMISYGKNNRYGHPHRETVRKLANIGAEIKKTQTNGAISFQIPFHEK